MKNKLFFFTIIFFLLIIQLPVFKDITAKDEKISAGSAAPLSGILGRPTDSSITINILAVMDMDIRVEYGTRPDTYLNRTAITRLKGNLPLEIILDGLQENTKYYYHVLYRKPGEKSFSAGKEYFFHTYRKPGNGFIFSVQADPHVDDRSDQDVFRRTLIDTLTDQPDFHIDLGDNFMTEKMKDKSPKNITARYLELRSYYEMLCHSVPLFIVLGNHDGERQQGGRRYGSEDITVLALQNRKLYFPNPFPDGFYTGNKEPDKNSGYFEDYYAWEWGDALFVVLDPYRYTSNKSRKQNKSSDKDKDKTDDNWSFTLGKTQYDWFSRTLQQSKAKYKFVFCHQIIGGKYSQGRGGADYALYYEWGGKNEDGTWGFDKKRPGWGKPIHQLMKENKVTIFFHGHDHFFAREELDNIVYQLVPQPSHDSFKDPDYAEEYGYSKGIMKGNAGRVRVSVAPEKVTVDLIHVYEEGRNSKTAYSYTINAPGKN